MKLLREQKIIDDPTNELANNDKKLDIDKEDENSIKEKISKYR